MEFWHCLGRKFSLKLLRLHVDNFGKLSDLTLEFNDGINVINEPNAWGKSTLAAFIKAMFYGFDSKKAPGAIERERTFYMPWQGGVYGGELDFAFGNRKYRISRTFGASEKKDECHVYDLATNLESVDFNGNVGEILFDLDSNSFKRSVFIAQNDCASQTSDAINAKLGNLAENTNDINNYETAQESLKAIANSLNPNRATGSIKRRKNLLTELEEELRGYASALVGLEQLNEQKKVAEQTKDLLIKEREDMAAQLRIASEDSRRTELQKQYLEICSDCVQKLEALDSFKDIFSDTAPEDEAIAEALKNARELEEKQLHLEHLNFSDSEKTQYDKLSAMFANTIPTEVEIDTVITRFGNLAEVKEEKTRLEASLEEREKTTMVIDPLPEKPKPTNVFTVLGIVFGILGVAAFALALVGFFMIRTAPFYMFGGVGLLVVATIFFFVALGKAKGDMNRYQTKLRHFQERQQDEIDEITKIREQALLREKEITGVEEETRQFLERVNVFCGVSTYSGALYELKAQAKDYNRLSSRMKEIEATEFEIRSIKNQLEAFELQYKLSLGEQKTARLIMIQTEAVKYRAALESANAANDRKCLFEQNNNMQDLTIAVTAEGSLDDINRRISEIDDELETVRTGIDQCNRQIDNLKEELDHMDEKQVELLECRKLQESEQHRYNIISLTQQFLGTAREQFTARYMAPISNAFRKYYNQIIKSDGDDWVIDANIAMKRRELGELRSVEHLSVGFQDLIGVCMRLALVDAMYQEEKPFLVLDDPFVNLDEEKTIKGMNLLHFVSAEYQTIYFTCHGSRTPV